jgi:hypothetical protein
MLYHEEGKRQGKPMWLIVLVALLSSATSALAAINTYLLSPPSFFL